MRCSSKGVDEGRRRWVVGGVAAALLAGRTGGGEGGLAAEGTVVRIVSAQIRRQAHHPDWLLDADLEWGELPAAWQPLLERGVPHPFEISLQLWQRRWWWPNQLVWAKRWRFAFVWRPSTRVWWLRHNDQVVAQGGWEQVTAPLRTIRGWSLLPLQRLEANPELEAELGVGVEETQLGPMLRLPGVEAKASLVWQALPYRWQPWHSPRSAPR